MFAWLCFAEVLLTVNSSSAPAGDHILDHTMHQFSGMSIAPPAYSRSPRPWYIGVAGSRLVVRGSENQAYLEQYHTAGHVEQGECFLIGKRLDAFTSLDAEFEHAVVDLL